MLSYCGPIDDAAVPFLRQVIEATPKHRRRLAVQLETTGGFIESAERMVNVFRHHYRTVDFLITSYAMSAGTVLVMSGNDIYMDYAATLGPIDPQLLRPDNRRFVPALGYLEQFSRLIERSASGVLTDAELAYLLRNFDPGELYQYEQARDLSVALIEDWLARYKFKDWRVTAGSGTRVTSAMKRARAKDVALKLNETQRWHSHNRGISMDVARRDLKLQIIDIDDNAELSDALRVYNQLMLNYRMARGHHEFIVVWEDGYHGH